MRWDVLAGEDFARWLKRRKGGGDSIRGDQRIQPFDSSFRTMRHAFVKLREAGKRKSEIVAQTSRQQTSQMVADLGTSSKGAQLLRWQEGQEDPVLELTTLGVAVLDRWENEGLDGDIGPGLPDNELELRRAFALLDCAVRLGIKYYVDMYRFFLDIRKVMDDVRGLLAGDEDDALKIFLILEWLNKEINGYNPWDKLYEGLEDGVIDDTSIGRAGLVALLQEYNDILLEEEE